MITSASNRAGFRAPRPPPTSGVSASLFDEMVKDGRMPQPKQINSRRVWDRRQLDEAFEQLPDNSQCNPWDEAAA